MPNDNGYVIDFETLQRISKSVREQERGVTKAGMADQSQADQQEGTAFVEVTGAATTAGYYPAREKWYDIESNTWTYAQDSCVAWEMNGSTLDSGKTYKGTLARSVVEGGVVKHVFAVQASGGGGAAGSTAKVLIIGALNGSFYKAGTCIHNGTAWVCQPVDDFAIDVNGLALEIGRRYVGSLIGARNGKDLYGIQTWWGVVTDVYCDATGLHQTKREI